MCTMQTKRKKISKKKKKSKNGYYKNPITMRADVVFLMEVFGLVRNIIIVAMSFISALLNHTLQFRSCWKKLLCINVFHYLCFSTCKSSRSKQVFIKIPQYLQENTSAGGNFIKKRLQHRCFLLILRNFWEQFFI